MLILPFKLPVYPHCSGGRRIKKTSQEITSELFLVESAHQQVEQIEKHGGKLEEVVSGTNHIICKGVIKLQSMVFENSRFGTKSEYEAERCRDWKRGVASQLFVFVLRGLDLTVGQHCPLYPCEKVP